MRNITKEIFLSAVTCPTLGWRLRNAPPQQALSLGEKFRIEQGLDVGRRARALYPSGVLIEERDTVSAAPKTQRAMADPGVSILFEAAFLTDGCATRADILKRQGQRWQLVEVKSGINDKAEHIDDLAYTAMVLSRCGVDIASASLLLISKDYRLGMDDRALFVEIDHTQEVLERAEVLASQLPEIVEMTNAPDEPKPRLIIECRDCPQFADCTGKGIENPIFNLPRLHPTKFNQLTKAGIVRIEDIPADFPLTDNQAIVRDAVQTGKPFLGDGLAAHLGRISWPACYLDFETVSTAVPLYPDTAPYTPIPTQYSAHHCAAADSVTGHCEYLADPKQDCRLELAQRLLKDLRGTGSIVVYTNFERTIISGLAATYPQLAAELNLLIDRIIDLKAIIERNFYQKGFRGSFSIKNVLPVVVAEMSYDHLPIADGDTAMATFVFMAWGHYEGQRIEALRRELLAYCKQDTFAMVKLHSSLTEVAACSCPPSAIPPSAIRM